MLTKELGKRAWTNRLKHYQRKVIRLKELDAPKVILDWYKRVTKAFEAYKTFADRELFETDKGEVIQYKLKER